MSLSRILMSSVEESTTPETTEEVTTTEEVAETTEVVEDKTGAEVEATTESVEGETTETTEKIEEDAVEEMYLDPAYDHEDGARLIAMETAEALHDVFLESFYGIEQCDILAIRDGVALEGSQYETIVEGIATSTFKNIKDILAALWKKVVAFFNSIIMFVEQFTKSGRDFFAKYDKEFAKLKNVPGFKFTMYNYADNTFENATDEHIQIAVTNAKSTIDNVGTIISNALNPDGSVKDGEAYANALDEVAATLEKVTDDAEIYSICSQKNATDSKSFNAWVFGLFRNGAKPGEKEEIEVSDVYAKLQVIRDFKADPVKKIKGTTDSVYKEATTIINNISASVQNAGGANAGKAAGVCRASVTMLSKLQSIQNALLTGWKVAVKERDAAYKQMAMSALSYARKNNK